MANADDAPDIRKKALLVKMKTKKKKYFVLREESSASGPARLEYYDSEKKFRSGAAAKRCIVLKNCFSINPKSDSKHQFAIVLYTKDDCFGLVFDSDAVRQDWLSLLVDLRSQSIEESTLTTKPLFEHVWPVTVKSKGLGNREKNISPGPYRLCLTNRDISLIRLNNDEPDITVPLDAVRRCGHSHDFFFLELGRSAVTGPGELWLQVEDTVISQNMHEAILNAMKNNTFSTIMPYRPRLSSNVDGARGSGSHRTGRPGGALRSNTISGAENKPSPINKRTSTCSTASTTLSQFGSAPDRFSSRLESSEQSFDDQDMGYPSSGSTRSITPDECIEEEPQDSSEYFSMNPASHQISSVAEDKSDYLDFKPQATAVAAAESDYMPMPGKASTPSTSDQVASSSNYELMSVGAAAGARTSLASSVNVPTSDYMKMAVPAAKAAPDTSSRKDVGIKKAGSTASKGSGASDYISMKTPTDEGYMDMKAGSRRSTTDEPAHGSGSSVSSVVSLTSGTVSSAVSSRSSAADAPNIVAFHSLSRLQEFASEGYIDMKPQNTHSSHNSALQMHLDIVPSFLHDTSADGVKTSIEPAVDLPQKRAYSVGSKPQPPSKPLCSGSYIDMSGAAAAAMLQDEAEKSCSAPHLNDDCQTASQRPLSGAAAAEVSDRFMELDFHPKADNGQDFRARASSGGAKDFSSRKLNHNAKDALARITFFRRGGTLDSSRRPRTSTICQETLRPRTSSFGTAGDARPRSSSGGNARLRDVFGPDTLLGAKRLSVQRSTSKRSSVESSADSLVAGADYLNMTCGTAASRLTPTVTPTGPVDQYMVMKPGTGNAPPASGSPASDYFEMGRAQLQPATAADMKSRPGNVPPTSASSTSDYFEMGRAQLQPATTTFNVKPGTANAPPASASPASDYFEIGRAYVAPSTTIDVRRSITGKDSGRDTRAASQEQVESIPTTTTDADIPTPFDLGILSFPCLHYAAAGVSPVTGGTVGSQMSSGNAGTPLSRPSAGSAANISLPTSTQVSRPSLGAGTPVSTDVRVSQPTETVPIAIETEPKHGEVSYAALDLEPASSVVPVPPEMSRAAALHEYAQIDFSRK